MITRSIYMLTLTLLPAVFATFTACNKLVDAAPTGRVPIEIAYIDSASAEANVNGIYYNLQQNGSIYNGSFYAILPLLSDEASIGSSSTSFYLELANNNISTNNSIVSGLWSNNYKAIYQANSVLENVIAVPMSAERLNRYMGEARFIRAYCYFILIQYFDEVPLVTTTNYIVNQDLPKSDTSVIYQFIIDELEQAAELLPGGFSSYGNVRVRACRETAEALLSRVYLFLGDWANAETYATRVINSPAASFANSFSEVLKPNSPESLWEIWASSTSYAYRNNASTLLVPADLSGVFKPAVLPSAKLVSSFEADDIRKSEYISLAPGSQSFYVNKYRDLTNGTDQGKILRLSEMYLIRAEARAMQGNITGSGSAAEDVDKIRSRAGLTGTTATTQQEMIDAILHERFIELMFENHRWFDLRRTGRIRIEMSQAKPDTWKSNTPILLPIPATEIGVNQNLLPQNEGY